MAELNLKQITDRLNAEFTGDTRKLVFWYDDRADFAEDIDTLQLENAKLLKLTPGSQFATKYFLERQDKTTNYLIYAPFPKPDVRENHLEDTMLYSKRFFADRASLLSVDLGIDQKYKQVIEKHIKFFASKERTQRFYDLEIENFNEENILIGLMSAICRTRTCSFDEVVRVLLTDGDLQDNAFLAEMDKYDLLPAFWKFCEQQFGYSDSKPTLEKLVVTMASGSFARGKEEKAASASMVFVGNINQSVDVLLKTSSLFDPFPPEMGTDTAFLDRIHCYIPGWEIPKFRPEHFTNDYGFITDYLAEFIRELRKEQQGDALDKYFHLGKNLNQRDTIAVRKMVGGFIKLLYPDGEYTKDQLEEILKLSLEMRRRVKEQLKKLGGMEFYDVNFSYIDNETFEEHYVSVPEQGGGKLIPEGMCNPGQVYTVSQGKSGMIGVFRLESQMLPGSGKFERTGLGTDRDPKEASNTAFNFLKANGNRISGSISTTTKDYIINYQDLQGIGMTKNLALPTLIALCSIALSKPVVSSMAVLGEISISGTMIKAEELANSLQVCLDSGAKKVLLPITSAADLGSVPAELVGCFNLIFYQTAEDAVFKALGVE